MSKQEPSLELVELTVMINCVCGNFFYPGISDNISICYNCGRKFKINTEFKDFSVEEIS